MKLLRYLSLCLICSTSYADYVQNGINYSDCDSCTTHLEFIAHVKQQRQEARLADGMPPYQYVILNSGSLDYFRSDAQALYVSVGHRKNPGSNQWGFQVTANSIETDNLLAGYKVAGFKVIPSTTSNGIKRLINTNDVGSVFIESNTIAWLGAVDFIARHGNQLDRLMSSATINPFYFLTRPAIVKLKTIDNYYVYLTKSGSLIKPAASWKVIYASDLEYKLFYDHFGNTISHYRLPAPEWNRLCTIEFNIYLCRRLDSSGEFLGDFSRTDFRDYSNMEHIDPRAGCRPGNNCK